MKIAQVGLGRFGENHARILNKLDVLKFVCDTDEERAREFSIKYHVPAYYDLDRMLTSAECDAVVICTPITTHAELVKKCLEHKKHVFVEKPLAIDTDDALELERLAKKNNVILTCGYIERYNPTVRTAYEFIKKRAFGKLIKMEFDREDPLLNRVKDVGIIHNNVVHDIDLAMLLFGGVPKTVYAMTGSVRHTHEDHVDMILQFRGGKYARISANWITSNKVRKFRAICARGEITVDLMTQNTITDERGSTQIIKGNKVDILQIELGMFLSAIEGHDPPIVSAKEAVNVTRVAEAALLSSEKNEQIHL